MQGVFCFICTIGRMVDAIIHRWFKVPYTLNVRYHHKPKRPRATILFIHGLGNTGDAWKDVIDKLPRDVRVISIDLLGFGDSPAPTWAIYNAKTQARSVLATYLKLRIRTPIYVVGHSLGALVAIELSKRYPLLIKGLVLCSPPLYSDQKTKLPRNETVLIRMYQTAQNHPETFLRLSALGAKYGLVNDSFSVTKDNVDTYMATLGTMIINQTSLEDAYDIKVPTVILNGKLDPLVVSKNYKRLAKSNGHITVKNVLSGHEVMGRYVDAVVDAITQQLPSTKKNDINKDR